MDSKSLLRLTRRRMVSVLAVKFALVPNCQTSLHSPMPQVIQIMDSFVVLSMRMHSSSLMRPKRCQNQISGCQMWPIGRMQVFGRKLVGRPRPPSNRMPAPMLVNRNQFVRRTDHFDRILH